MVYLLPIFAAAYGSKRSDIYLMAAVSSVLIIMAHFLAREAVSPTYSLLNRGIQIIILWIVAFLLADRRIKEDRLFAYQATLEEQVRARTADLDAELAERKQVEADLRVSEEKFARLFQSSPAGVAVSRIDNGQFIDTNRAYTRLAGYSREELIGHTVSDLGLFAPESRAGIAAQLQRGALLRDIEIDLTTKCGETRHCLFSSDVLDLPVGRCIQTSIVDITARKKAERAQAFLAAIVETSTDAIVAVDLNGVVTSWNHGAEQLTGYPASEIVGRPAASLPKAFLTNENWLAERLPALQRGEKLAPCETTRQARDGHEATVIVALSGIVDTAGKGLGISAIVHDITERKRIEVALTASEAQLRAVIDNTPDLIFSVDREYHLLVTRRTSLSTIRSWLRREPQARVGTLLSASSFLMDACAIFTQRPWSSATAAAIRFG